MIVVVSDLHLDHVTHGVARFEEVAAAVHQSVDYAIAQRARLWVCLGDVMDPDSGSCVFRCVRVLVEACVRLAQAEVPALFVAGNHDVVEDGTGETTLSPLRMLPLVTVADTPRVLLAYGAPARVCLPFTATSHAYDPHDFVRENAEYVRGGIVLSHLTHVPGVQPGEETKDMPRGREVLFPWGGTRAARARVQGHYHRAQVVNDPSGLGPPMHIVGSPARLTHGEESNEPRFLVVDV